MNNYLFLFL